MGVYMSAITTSTQARMKPPPIPCTPRAMMSVIIVGASPDPSDPMRKMTTPEITNGRLPNMSESFPTIGTTTVEVSM